MSAWRKKASADLGRLGVDADALFAHLAKANHLRRPGAPWRKKLIALVPAAEAIAVLLRPFTPAGALRPREDAAAAFGAIWASLEFGGPDLLGVIAELVPWCQKELGTSHQAATVGVMVLGLWPDDTRPILEQFRDDASLKSLIATVRAALRRQAEAHPKG